MSFIVCVTNFSCNYFAMPVINLISGWHRLGMVRIQYYVINFGGWPLLFHQPSYLAMHPNRRIVIFVPLPFTRTIYLAIPLHYSLSKLSYTSHYSHQPSYFGLPPPTPYIDDIIYELSLIRKWNLTTMQSSQCISIRHDIWAGMLGKISQKDTDPTQMSSDIWTSGRGQLSFWFWGHLPWKLSSFKIIFN